MKRALWAALALGFVTIVGCGDGGSSGSSGGGGSNGSSGSNTTGMQSCTEHHECVNGACTCSDGPNKDQTCCDPDDSNCTTNKCDSYCQVCM